MPKIDPHTGCSVMTTNEFWQHEAKQAGTTAEQLQEEFWGDYDASLREEEERLKSPQTALEMINESASACEDFNYRVDVVKEVISSHVSGFATSKGSLVADCICSDGKERRLKLSWFSSGGSYYEPPEYDEWLEEITNN